MRRLAAWLLRLWFESGPHGRVRLVRTNTGRLRIVALLVALPLLAACYPKPDVIRPPGPVQYRDRLVVEPIPAELLRAHPIATGPVSQCVAVAAARRAELEACNADKAQLRQRGGE